MAGRNMISGGGRGLAGKAAKRALKGVTEWPRFCWNCGRRIRLGQTLCPECGAVTNGELRYLSPHAPHQPSRAPGVLHPTVLRYSSKMIIGTIVFMILFSAGLSVFMFASGELDFDDEGIHIMSMILTVLWIFWGIWLIAEYGGIGRRLKTARLTNRLPGSSGAVCGVCRKENDRRSNYCTSCGCILMK